MPSGDMGGELDRADPYHLTILEAVVDARCGKSQSSEKPQKPERSESGIAGSASSHDFGVAFAHPQLGTRRLLQVSKATGVIEVSMRVEQDFNIGDVEAEQHRHPPSSEETSH